MKEKENLKQSGSITRRSFLNRAAAGSAGIALIPFFDNSEIEGENQEKWPEGSGYFRFHLIGQAHIDPVWLWPWTEGMAVVHSTFRSALDRMNENPDFAFTASSAQFYQWIAENDPGMLKEIRKRVEEGRWDITGGWWVEPDVNIPCGEALVRQGLYGQLTFERLLGKRSKVAFNPDSFGHAGTLPQIIKLQGMENYVFMRPGPKEKNLQSGLFWWESPDGSRVLTYRIPISYNDNKSVRSRLEQVMVQEKDQPVKTLMTYYGAGDHGGGATKENISSILEIRSEKGAPVVMFSTPDKYFSEIRKDKSLELPVVKDDLQHHATGCYTAESEIKKNNRIAEAALLTAEKIASVGSVVWGYNYPSSGLTEAWKRVLFLQFHDSLAGTSVPEHSKTAREGFGFAIDTAGQALYKAVQKLEWNIAAEDPASQYLLVFNPHAWETTEIIEYDFNWDLSKSSIVEDESGNRLDHQWNAGSTETGSRRRIIIKIQLPPFGYKQIRIREGQHTEIRQPVSASINSIENEFLKVTFIQNGSIGITDKKSGREVFNPAVNGCRAVVINDPSDTWSHDIKSFSNEIGSFANAEIKLLEDGPLRSVMRVKTSYGNSILTTDWILSSGSRILEAKVQLDWHEHLKMLKFSFPLNTENAVATYETPYGFISRTANGDEEPGQRWIDVSGNESGLTVVNDAKYGYCVSGNDMRISIARSAVYAHHNPRVLDMNSEHIWQDQGIQTFRMLIVPHAGDWKEAGIPRIAEEFIAPPVMIYQGIHRGKLSKTASLLTIAPGNLIVSTIKKAEKDNNLIVRCVETSGTKTSGSLKLSFINLEWNGEFKPCEIKTLKVNIMSRKVTEVNLLEE